jgi:hypothetical protein
MTAPLVVLIWAGLNAALVLAMLPYREDGLFIGLYGAGVGIVVLTAGVVWLVRRARQDRGRFRMPAASISAFYLALAVVLACLTFAYGYWFAVAAVPPMLAAITHWRKERLPTGVVPAPTSVPNLPVERTRAWPALTRPVKAVTATAVAVGFARSLLRRRGRDTR